MGYESGVDQEEVESQAKNIGGFSDAPAASLGPLPKPFL